MITVRKSNERGHANHGWLDSYHTFSFAGYYDPAHMGFRALRVINEDFIAPAKGFGTHPHNDMEIITYVMEGELAHKDSMGNGRVIKAGEVQGMSAGTGITHSEFNASQKQQTHLLQIWIQPHTRGVTPSYGEFYPQARMKNSWALAASEKGEEGGIVIHQDARLYVAAAEAGKDMPIPVPPGRFGWLQIAKGEVQFAGQLLQAGDGVSFSGGDADKITVQKASELLLFDLK